LTKELECVQATVITVNPTDFAGLGTFQNITLFPSSALTPEPQGSNTPDWTVSPNVSSTVATLSIQLPDYSR
jgi:hypothetical protein